MRSRSKLCSTNIFTIMKKLISILSAALMLIFVLSGCSAYLDPDGVDFDLTESGEVISSSEVSLKQFKSNVVGYGWKCVDFRDIKDDGTLASHADSIQDGWGPTDYFFDESTVTSFFDNMAWPARCYSVNNYSFENSTVQIGSGKELRLLKLSGDKFTCVTRIGWKYPGKDKDPIPHYMYFKYKRMTEKELQEHRSKYTTDSESLLNNSDSQE